MKKLLCIILTILMVIFTFSACSNNTDEGATEAASNTSSLSAREVAEKHIDAIYGDWKYDLYEAGKYELFSHAVVEKGLEDRAAANKLSVSDYYAKLASDAGADFEDYRSYLTYKSGYIKDHTINEKSEYLGKNLKVTYEFCEESKMDDSYENRYRQTVDAFANELKLSDISSENITEITAIDFDCIYEGDDGNDVATILYVMVKHNGEWKVLSSFLPVLTQSILGNQYNYQ